MNEPLSNADLKRKYSILGDPDNDWREPSPVGDRIDRAIDSTPKYSPAAAFHERVRTAVEVVMRYPVGGDS